MPVQEVMHRLRATRPSSVLQIAGAHDAISAKIAWSVGFEAIWASSLGLSAVAGRRDEDELSWTETLDAAEKIADSVPAPVLLDANDGYGSAGIARLIVSHASKRGIKGVCFEDKVYPKKNSFADANNLLDTQKFVELLQACRDAADTASLLIVARTEALVLGGTVEQALERAERYAEAGAGAVIVHTRAKDVTQLRGFMSKWSGRCSVIAIPTSYPHTSLATFREVGVSAVIWANQLLRAAIGSMAAAAHTLIEDLGASQLEPNLPSMGDLLALSEGPLSRPQ